MISDTELRYVAVLVSSLPEIEIEVTGGDGRARLVRADTAPDALDAEEFRDAVERALAARDRGIVADVLEFDRGGPARIAVRPRGALVPVDGGRRWRRSCACGITDYIITPLDAGDALILAEAALRGTLDDPSGQLWVQRDPGLAMTLLAVEWPSDLRDTQAALLEQSLRDLSVMCRVQSGIADVHG